MVDPFKLPESTSFSTRQSFTIFPAYLRGTYTPLPSVNQLADVYGESAAFDKISSEKKGEKAISHVQVPMFSHSSSHAPQPKNPIPGPHVPTNVKRTKVNHVKSKKS